MGKPAERKRKRKKGRPSLLDLQKRCLRLQKLSTTPNNNNNNNNNSSSPQQQQQQQQSSSSSIHRRYTGRKPALPLPQSPASTAGGGGDEEEEEDEDELENRRKEKKLKLVLKLPDNNNDNNGPVEDESGGGDGGDEEFRQKGRRIRDVVDQKAHSSVSKATEVHQGDHQSGYGPTTSLPDKKLLLFILDRLQKKDTYGVFSEPVDSEELPDYHDIIQHPMDFGTVRKKLETGAYKNLEQFEKDVFLISSNAMTYNAPDTIYYRQARAIHELAKKNFGNLRQDSDNEQEPKIVRRGRPPIKLYMKKMAGKLAERAVSDFTSDATLANAGEADLPNIANDLSRKGSTPDKPGTADVVTRSSYALREVRSYSWASDNKFDMNDEATGSSLRGSLTKYGKKAAVIDESRRNTYNQPLPSTFAREAPVFAAFDGERKELVPVGLYMEHGYARSLARFAANLGPIGWDIAARKIQRSLPPGAKFGRGWAGDNDVPKQYQPPLLSSLPPNPSKPRPMPTMELPHEGTLPDRKEPSSNQLAAEEGHSMRNVSPANAVPPRSSDAMDCSEGQFTTNLASPSSVVRPKAPFPLYQNIAVQPTLNGFPPAFLLTPSAHAAKMVGPLRPPGSFGMDAPMTHSGILNLVSKGSSINHHLSRSQPDMERPKMASPMASANSLPDSANNSKGQQRWPTINQKKVSGAPDLNSSCQSPSSPASIVVVDSQQPDLALQL